MSKNNPNLLSRSEAGEMVVDRLRPRITFLRDAAMTAPLHDLDNALDEIEELRQILHQIVNGRRFTRAEMEETLSKIKAGE